MTISKSSPRETWLHYEAKHRKQGAQWIAGVDEVGRGCLAGPVVTAAVVFPDGFFLDGVDDSKVLSPKRRRDLFYEIIQGSVAYSFGSGSVEEIDRINILQSSLAAMRRSIESLAIRPDVVLVDGRDRIPEISIQQETIIDGDAKCFSIAAASILAKVVRDRLMDRYAVRFPQFGWEKNKGYGTATHRKALAALGATHYHRRSFAPVREAAEFAVFTAEISSPSKPSVGNTSGPVK